MNRIYLGAVLVLVLLASGLGLLSWRQAGKLAAQRQEIATLTEALKLTQAAMKRNAAVSVSRAKENAAAVESATLARRRLDSELSKHKAWNDEALPQGVQDALR